MPTIKVRPGKLIVCCGDDCIEIDTSDEKSSGGGDKDPPWTPPISGGAKIAADRFMTERLVADEYIHGTDFWSEVDQIESRAKQLRKQEKLKVAVELVVPRRSRLKLAALQRIASRLDASIEIRLPKEG